MGKPVLAWYFAPANNRLRYGDDRPIVLGETHSVQRLPIACEHGLHASVKVLDALSYAPSSLLYRVELSGAMDRESDKIAAQHRKYLWCVDAEEVLKEFARMCALDVIHLWDAPAMVVKYLQTGDESLRGKTQDAASAAAWSAARSAVWSAAESAVWSAAESAAWSAAESAAWRAAGSAAGSAARSVATNAVREALRKQQNLRLTHMINALEWEK